MAAAFVQHKIGFAFSATAVSAAFSGSVVSGNLICGYVFWNDITSSLTSVTDGTNTYTLVDNPTAVGTTGRRAMFYAMNVTGGSLTVTANFNATVGTMRSLVHEVSGLALTSALDQHAMNYQPNPGTGTDAVTSGSVTTTTNGQYIFGAAGARFETGAVAGTGFTYASDVGFTIPAEYLIQTSAGSIAATFTAGAGDDYCTGIMTFKVPASAGGAKSLLTLGVGAAAMMSPAWWRYNRARKMRRTASGIYLP